MRWLWAFISLLCLPAHALSVIEDAGQSLTLAAPAQRIISLAPSITENLFVIGAGNRVVGTSSASDYPAAAQSIPVIADYQSINLEAVAALHPDLIIAWQGGNSPAQLAALAQLRIPIYMQRTQTLPEIPLALMRLAQLTGLEKSAAPIIAQAYAQIPLLQDAPTPHLNAFYQVWHMPLMTINDENWVSDALKRCGASNLFANLTISAPTVSLETVVQKNPSLILAATPNAVPDNTLDMWRKWTNLSAVGRHGLLFVDADAMNRATLRTLSAAQQMCGQIAAVRAHL